MAEIGYRCTCAEDNVVRGCEIHDARAVPLSPEERAREVRRLLIQTVGELGQGLRILSAEYSGGHWLSMPTTIRQMGEIVQAQDELMKELPRG